MSAILTQPGISSGAAPKQTIVKPANVISISPDITSISSTLRGYIQRRMESFNCSAHDVAHVYRVSSLTIQIAAASIKEDNDKKNSLDLRTAYIAGLCHDLLDPKFGEPIGVENELRSILRSEKGLDDAKINVIIQVAKVSYLFIHPPELLSIYMQTIVSCIISNTYIHTHTHIYICILYIHYWLTHSLMYLRIYLRLLYSLQQYTDDDGL